MKSRLSSASWSLFFTAACYGYCIIWPCILSGISQVLLVWLNLLFLMSISLMPFSCGLLGHFLHNRAAQEIYFGNMFVAAALLAVQWLVAKKKGLINEDDPIDARLMGERLMFFPIGLPVAMVVAYFKPLAGSWAFAAVLIVLRLWQKRAHRAEATNP